MERMKLFIQTTLLVSFLTLFSFSLRVVSYYIKNGDFFTFEGWQILALMLLGVLTAIPTSLLLITKDTEHVRWNLRKAIHLIICCALVMVFGNIFGWYEGTAGAVAMFINFIVVYALVWIGNYFLGKHEENRINEVLKTIKDEE